MEVFWIHLHLQVVHLGEAAWSLGARDSARVYLQEVVRADPFYAPPADLLNPDLRRAFAQVRQQTAVIGLRGPSDTVLTPLRDTLPIEIAVGRPGEVRLLLRFTVPQPHDSLLMMLPVDSVAIARIPLAAPGTKLDVESGAGDRLVGTTAAIPFVDPRKERPAGSLAAAS